MSYKIGNRTESAALLAWYLESVWRLDPEEVPDAICDGPGDKGIDALYVDDDSTEIVVFQGKWRKDPGKSTQGDSELKAFLGAASYFESSVTVDGLLASKPNAELLRLLTRQGIREKIEADSYTVRLVFVTNAELDLAGRDYVETRSTLQPHLQVYTGASLVEVAEQTKRPALRTESVELTGETGPIVVKLTPSERMAISLIPADQLVKLPGIADQTLFNRNVRLSVGKTRINNELRTTVVDMDEHRLFPAFHNGLTLLTEKLETDGSVLKLTGVGVVNGCQSLTTLFDNQKSITDSLKLLVKVIEVPSDGRVADKITYRSNNQNAVTLRDQRSNDKAVRALQDSVLDSFGGKFFFRIKQGEQPPKGARVLENTTAAQLVMAVYLREPWAAVRKVRLFDQDFRRIFTRSLTAYRLYLLDVIDRVIAESRNDLTAELVSSFAAIRFTLVHLVAAVLRQSESGTRLLDEPESYLSDLDVEEAVLDSLRVIVAEVIQTANDFVAEMSVTDPSFDPKVAFKSQGGVKKLELEVVRDAVRQDKRNRSYLFKISPAVNSKD